MLISSRVRNPTRPRVAHAPRVSPHTAPHYFLQGWSEIGFLAAEIKQPERVLPKGLLIAAVVVVAAYAMPVIFGVALAPDLSLWRDGFLISLAGDIAPWLSYAMLVSASLANLSVFLVSLAAYARTLQAAAREGMVPFKILRRNMTRFNTPVPAIVVMGVTTAALSFLDFEQLVVVDSVFFVLSCMAIKASFLLLRYQEPELPRPYLFPGGTAGAWIAVCLTESIAMFAIYTVVAGDAVSGGVVIACVAFLGLLSLVWSRWLKNTCGGTYDGLEDDARSEGLKSSRLSDGNESVDSDSGYSAPSTVRGGWSTASSSSSVDASIALGGYQSGSCQSADEQLPWGQQQYHAHAKGRLVKEVSFAVFSARVGQGAAAGAGVSGATDQVDV